MSVKRCRLVAYLRVSTDQQGRSGLGLEAQRARVEAYAHASGCALVAEYVEVESGRRNDRPELAKALAHAKRARATLVIAALDRLGRNVAFLASLMESGVEFVCADNPNATRLTLHILAAVAEDEALRTSQRVKAALGAYKARGGLLGASRPECRNLRPEVARAGRETANAARRAEARADLAPLADTLRGMLADGLTRRAMAQRLNELGHVTRSGGAWHQAAVSRAISRLDD